MTETFTSQRYGFTFSYPSGWVTKPATEPWTTGIPDFASSTGDVLYDSVREGDLWIAVASEPIGDSNPDTWAAETIAFDQGCTATEPITVDGATGLVGRGDCARSAVTSDSRGYFFWLYTGGDDPSLVAPYDSDWFKEFLATVQLPSNTGSAPAPTETFTSDRHGVTISYPNGWVTRPAIEPWTKDIPDFMSNAGDVIYEPVREGDLWIAVASQPIGDTSPDAWAAETIAFDDGCTATEPITVDGATGLIGTSDCARAAVASDGRGYFFWLYTSGDDSRLDAYDRAWFQEVLATVQLQPGAAVDAPPSASP